MADARAQVDRPVVFAHGYRSDSTTWEIVPLLAQQWRIRPIVRSGPRFSQYQTQGDVMRDYIGADTIGLIGVGHSNGGVVLREARSQGVPFQTIVTIGTPHVEAPFAQSVRSGFVLSTSLLFGAALSQPFVGLPTPHQWWVAVTQNGMRIAALTWPAAYHVYFGDETNSDVLPQMLAGSDYRMNLLGRPNPQGSPESAVPLKVSIQSRAHNSTSGIIFAGAAPTSINFYKRGVQGNIGIYFLLAYYWSIRSTQVGPYSPLRAAMAAAPAKFITGASAFAGLDRSWCRIIGTYQGPNFLCAPSDGVVPTSMQHWAGANFQIQTFSLGHSYLTKDPNVADLVGIVGFAASDVSRR